MHQFQYALNIYLQQFEEIHLLADWPEDIAHFCKALILRPLKSIALSGLTISLIAPAGESAQPHNALADARALKEAYMGHGHFTGMPVAADSRPAGACQ